MNCPTCNNVQLVMSERQGVEIDYCPQCRGVWLDRGELDKIIERASNENKIQSPQNSYPQKMHHEDYKYHKKKHWLNELFD